MPGVVRKAKIVSFRLAETVGVGSLILNSSWRRKRLLILCYHGIAQEDEHRWCPGLYIDREQFRSRMALLREYGCNVLSLAEGIERLYAGTLPPRAVVITFDDGMYDFYRHALPILREFSFPATVYLTTYYCRYNRPVFDPMCSYLLWKARGGSLEWPGVVEQKLSLDDAGLASAERQIKTYATRQELSGAQKDGLIAELAARLEINYQALCERRILHLMNPVEVSEAAGQGIDIQLHTHRHRVSKYRERLLADIDENGHQIHQLTGANPKHFCYPGGFYLAEFPEWLGSHGVVSATTCSLGMASSQSDPRLLPRLLDTATLTEAEFRAWLTGLAAWVTPHAESMVGGQLLEEPLYS